MFRYLIFAPLFCASTALFAQETTDEPTEAASQETTDLLTDTELQTLVAPVALYPDTLLIQILVASTQPLEIVKAERFLIDNADRDPAELEPEIEAMGLGPVRQRACNSVPRSRWPNGDACRLDRNDGNSNAGPV